MKNIVVCSDGTGNADIKGRGTNVFKLFEAVNLHDHEADPARCRQVAFYDDGVGTESVWFKKMIGGAVGWGLSENVRRLYADIVRVYDPGSNSSPADRIYLFGFSRGAHTVRTLAGMIARCGQLDRRKFNSEQELIDMVGIVYKLYRGRSRAWLTRLFHPAVTLKKIEEFMAKYCLGDYATPSKEVKIEFIGVWDTVDAVGFPVPGIADFWNNVIWQFKFKDRTLSAIVQCARHALSIDDERLTFHPTLWDESIEKKGTTPPRIEQVWFSGVHSNVGGGYPKQGMSLITLNWMMAEAENRGLRFVPSDRNAYRDRRNVHDKLYDSRAGMASIYRYRPRDIEELCHKNGTEPKINLSVLERVAQGTLGYAPANLPNDARVVATRQFPGLDEGLKTVTMKLRSIKPDMLAELESDISRRHHSNLVFFASAAAVLIAVALAWSSLAAVIATWLPDTNVIDKRMLVYAVTAAGAVAVIAILGWGIGVRASWARKRMTTVASERWKSFRLDNYKQLMD